MLSKIWKVFRWREEDLRWRIILAPYVFCFWFTCKGLYFSLALGSSLLPTLKRSYCSTRRHFCLVCPPDALKNRHKRHKKIAPRRFVLWLITIVKADNFVWRDHGLIHVIITFFCRPLFLIPSRSFLGTTRTEISACKPNERLFRLQRSPSLLGGKQPLY